MRDIHKDGTPTAVAAPASNPRIRRRVIGTGWDHEAADRAEGIGRYMARRHPTWNRRLHFQPIQFICTVAKRPWDERPVFPVPCLNGWGHEIQLSLTFLSHRGLTPALLGKTFFRPAARPLRPEANARQRDAPSGAKVFGRWSWRSAPRHICRHHPRRRVIQYPRAARIEPRGCGVLDTPLSRGMTGA
jgi:hypothetical protein